MVDYSYNYVFNDKGDDDKHNAEEQNCQNLANFQARNSRFCVVIHLDSTYKLMTMVIMILTILVVIIMMMNMSKIVITRLFGHLLSTISILYLFNLHPSSYAEVFTNNH